MTDQEQINADFHILNINDIEYTFNILYIDDNCKEDLNFNDISLYKASIYFEQHIPPISRYISSINELLQYLIDINNMNLHGNQFRHIMLSLVDNDRNKNIARINYYNVINTSVNIEISNPQNLF